MVTWPRNLEFCVVASFIHLNVDHPTFYLCTLSRKRLFVPEEKKSDNMDIKSETSTVLDLPPSAVAFCPSHPEFYVVGTYFLHPKKETDESKGEESSEEAPQKRTGTLILYRLEGSVL